MINFPIEELVDKVRVTKQEVDKELNGWDGSYTKLAFRISSLNSGFDGCHKRADLTNWLLLELLNDETKLEFRVKCEVYNSKICRAGQQNYFNQRIKELEEETDEFSKLLLEQIQLLIEN